MGTVSGNGMIFQSGSYRSTVIYSLSVDRGRVDGSIQIEFGASGKILHEWNDELHLHLYDGQKLKIVISRPIDRSNDSWEIMGSSTNA